MLVYLAGPITPKDEFTLEDNRAAALAVFLRLIEGGVNALCVHLSCCDLAAHEISYERWMAYDFAMIDICTHVLMLPRWKTSSGARRELEYAMQTGKVVVYDVGSILV